MHRPSCHTQRGFTIIELLIALVLTGILTLATIQFYSSINQQVLSQNEIADMQNINRSCLEELGTSLKSAGFGVPTSHPAYEVDSDSLFVYSGNGGSVDTVVYFLQEFTDAEYTGKLGGHPTGITVYNLMKRVNTDDPVVFADYLTDLRFTVINPKLIAITVEVQATIPDETYQVNSGYRTFINTERVVVRNTPT